MELSRIKTLLLRWIWLLIAGLVVGVLIGLLISKIVTPVYQASSKIMVSPAPQVDSVNLTILETTELIDTYIEFLKAKVILDEVSRQLNYEIDPRLIQIEQVENAQLIEIKVENTDPKLSAALANRLVDVLIQQNKNLQDSWYGDQEVSLIRQIGEVEQQISDLQLEFKLMQEEDLNVQMVRVDEQIALIQDQILEMHMDIDKSEIQLKAAEIENDIDWLSLPEAIEQQAQVSEMQTRLSHLESNLRMYQQLKTDPSARSSYSQTTIDEQISSLQDEISNLQNDLTRVKLANEATDLQNDVDWLSNSDISIQRSQLADKKVQLSQLVSILQMYQQIRVNLVVLGKSYQLENMKEDPQIQQLQSTLDLYSEIYLNLTHNLEAIRLATAQSLPNITQIEMATIPEDPIRPLPLFSGLLYGLIGLLLTAGWVGWYEGKDATVKTQTDIMNIFGLPVIGNIQLIDHKEESDVGLYISKQPYSPISDAFRTIQAKLILSRKGSPLTTILVSSSESHEGKTTIATNLAMSFAQSDKKTVLLDANSKNPSVRDLVGTRYKRGLTDMLEKETDLQDFMRHLNKMNEVSIIPYGNLYYPGLLDEGKLTQILKVLKAKFDIVVIDGPPMSVPDTQLWASKVDGVLLVIQPEFTPIASVIDFREHLHQSNATLFGIVFNTLAVKQTGYKLFRNRFKDILEDVSSLTHRMISRIKAGFNHNSKRSRFGWKKRIKD